MAHYVDGYVLPVHKKNMKHYKRLATLSGKIWMEHGALEFRECVGDDLNIKGLLSFTKMAKVKKGESVLFSFIVFKSRTHRDRVNAKVMKDPRLANMGEEKMPFDCKRMAVGGFKTIVDLLRK